MIEIIILFGIHFFADFICQTREMGGKKSENLKILSYHGLIIFSIFFFCGTLIFNNSMILFSIVYTFIHCLQDWYIWRGYKWFAKWRIAKKEFNGDMKSTWMEEELKIFKYWEDKWFYTTIGLDQTLHFITIVAVYNWVM